MAPRYDIDLYTFDPAATYFLDTNVWILVNGPTPPNNARAAVYSNAIKRLHASGAKTFIDALVMSEFANRWARFEFQRTAGSDFKAFRKSALFKVVAQDIAIALRAILSMAKPVSGAFANIDLAGVISTFESGDSDFNDLLIVETCRIRSCVLVTDDRDMKMSDVAIVTANQALLTP